MEYEHSVELQHAKLNITEALRQITQEGGTNNFVLILADLEKNYYAQLISERGSSDVCIELSSNEYIETGFELTEKQIKEINAMGWDTSENALGWNSDNSGNFTKMCKNVTSEPVRIKIADEILSALTEVYNISDHRLLSFTVNLE